MGDCSDISIIVNFNPKEEEEDSSGCGGSTMEDYYLEKGLEEEHVGWEEDEDENGDLFVGFWDQNSMCLNLSLNYEEVMDAWCDRGPLLVDGINLKEGEAAGIPTLLKEEQETRERRKARVLKYREKRRSRVFSKKIRYHVRKINAEKRPRVKGRFVKRK